MVTNSINQLRDRKAIYEKGFFLCRIEAEKEMNVNKEKKEKIFNK